MPPCMGNFMEDADDETFIRLGKGAHGGNWSVACLVVVNTSPVNLPPISGLTNECAVRPSDKAICTSVHEGIFRTSNIAFTDVA